ncbi:MULTISPECIES: SDR family NAD(P)-dependent oxidoreductase [unclassified Rhodococcus (in: high G+C Gram-positive bacteria)]|uniref:SDR family NAD(P)-dependent oxidoreductase n=1 Tax=unclassified Rhodococcus (in: high G+C Gram-positive bacteria) TaxID=192944 RepID=UPI00092A780D|nr:SDR family oxidoreductase [Rhodococcus sp. M8]OLL19273.1 hypothetical protein BKE56_004270 [Rhodococcus sp. M8]QPG43097.1 SDR family oxidoreductase [Rhodococcus sp. M8]
MRALVTGASHGGIGGAICRRMVSDALTRDEVATLVLSATGGDRGLRTLAEELRGMGAAVHVDVGDLSDLDYPRELAARAVDTCEGLDVVVANAGLAQAVPLGEAEVEHWETMLAVHARASWLIAKEAFPALRDSKGSFIATGSVSGILPHGGLGAYSVAKAALIMMCQTLAMEWGPSGVRVNVVSPGPIRTPINSKLGNDPAELEAKAARRASILPIRRLGRPDDVAAAVAFLAGPDGGFITGENLVVDGGLSRSVNQHV